jgi:hypothetical protein
MGKVVGNTAGVAGFALMKQGGSMNSTGVRTMMARSLMVGLVAGAFVMLAPAQAKAQQVYVGSAYGHGGRGGDDRFRSHFDDRFNDRFSDRGLAEGFRDRERFEPQHRDWDRGRDGDRFHSGHDRGYGSR